MLQSSRQGRTLDFRSEYGAQKGLEQQQQSQRNITLTQPYFWWSTGMSNWIQHRKLKYFLCYLRDVILKIEWDLSKSIQFPAWKFLITALGRCWRGENVSNFICVTWHHCCLSLLKDDVATSDVSKSAPSHRIVVTLILRFVSGSG